MHIYRRNQQYEYGYANLQTAHKVTVSTRIHKSKKYLPAPGVRAIKTELPREGWRAAAEAGQRGFPIAAEAGAQNADKGGSATLLVATFREGKGKSAN
jgi:hypothetical protein